MKGAILLVAYGASTTYSRGILRAFSGRVQARFPLLPVRWAYTSLLLRERLARARQKSDSVPKALRRLELERFSAVVVQPLQTIPGKEHADVLNAALNARSSGRLKLSVGAPLLAGPGDIGRVAGALLRHLPAERRKDEDAIFMGHGARHEACGRYADLAVAVHSMDSLVHICAMNGAAGIADILPRLVSRRVWLLPLLSTVGRHAMEDMAGEKACSWRSQIVAAGHECVPVLKGTVEYSEVADIWLDHLAQAAAVLGL